VAFVEWLKSWSLPGHCLTSFVLSLFSPPKSRLGDCGDRRQLIVNTFISDNLMPVQFLLIRLKITKKIFLRLKVMTYFLTCAWWSWLNPATTGYGILLLSLFFKCTYVQLYSYCCFKVMHFRFDSFQITGVKYVDPRLKRRWCAVIQSRCCLFFSSTTKFAEILRQIRRMFEYDRWEVQSTCHTTTTQELSFKVGYKKKWTLPIQILYYGSIGLGLCILVWYHENVPRNS
jgi:hypothetical protein